MEPSDRLSDPLQSALERRRATITAFGPLFESLGIEPKDPRVRAWLAHAPMSRRDP